MAQNLLHPEGVQLNQLHSGVKRSGLGQCPTWEGDLGFPKVEEDTDGAWGWRRGVAGGDPSS